MSPVEAKPMPEIHVRPPGGIVAALLHRPLVLSLLLVVATFALYFPVHHYPFINFDDRDYVYENPHVDAGVSWATVQWAFTSSYAENWHPLTWLSHALDCQLFGVKAGPAHDVNVLFQALNAVLLFWVLLRATGYAGRSFMVAALFALHPINVESVAWVAERKNLLSMMFFLLALGTYRWYASRPQVGRYSVVALLFILGLMAKPQIITLPCVLLLWDYWPLQRIAFRHSLFAFRQKDASSKTQLAKNQRQSPDEEQTAKSEERILWLLVEKLPLLAIAAASAAITLHVQHDARMRFSRLARVGNGILAYGLYVKKALWPTHLAALYLHPGETQNWWKVSASGLILLAITVLVIVGRRHRYLPVGWFWFLGTLVPTLGIVQVGVQSMADRYAYLSFIGLFIMICWGTADLGEHLHLPTLLLPSAGVAVLLVLAVMARLQINCWQSDEVLWTHALQVTTGNWLAESQLGTALAIDGRIGEAVPHFYKTLALSPTDADANMGLAIYQLQRGNFREAIGRYEMVVNNKAVRPGMIVNAWVGMAKAYRALGDKEKAQECLQQAKRVPSRP
ncbi:MAG: tetratricopeptide repeat protein [Candidatus Korobacteraceae bacterium]|jgi:tetratricopeptide (TPR) repeat protein